MILTSTKRKVSIIFKDHVVRLVDSSKPDLGSIRSFHQKFFPKDIISEGKIRDEETLKLILEECIDELKLKGQEVTFLVPDSMVVVRKIQIPLDIQDNEIKGYIFLEIGSTIHLPFENPVFDIHVIDETEQARDVLLYAAPEETVSEYAHLLEEVKLRPVAAELSPFAIYRLYCECGKESLEDHTLCIELDIQTVNLSIFHGDNLVFMRHLRMNVDLGAWKKERGQGEVEHLVWAGSEDHIIGELQGVLSEVERVMSFYRFSLNLGKEQVTRILITGDHPNLIDFQERLSRSTEIPIDTFPDKIFYTTKAQQIPKFLYPCLGLSLKEVK